MRAIQGWTHEIEESIAIESRAYTRLTRQPHVNRVLRLHSLSVPTLIIAFGLSVLSTVANSETLGDDELIRQGAIIGRVDIIVDDVFEETAPLSAPYRLVNWLHIDSKTSTIAAMLLFHTGDRFERHTLDETERVLRGLRFLNAASVEVGDYHADTNTVDLKVRVHDVWTLSPGLSFGRKGGSNSSSVEIEENNFLGYGKRVELQRSSDVDRTSLRLRYLDPSLFGTWWQFSGAYASTSDGSQRVFDIDRPFYAMDTRWSAGALASDIVENVPRYRLGELAEQFKMETRRFELSGGLSGGVEDGWVKRYIGGFRLEDRDFSFQDDTSISLPKDRRIRYPWVGVQILEDRFEKAQNVNQIRRIEDVHLGFDGRLELGYIAPAFEASTSGTILRAEATYTSSMGNDEFISHGTRFSTRLEHGRLTNAKLEIAESYFRRHNRYTALFANLEATLTDNLDAEEQLTLGGDTGLRGYPLRYQSGRHKAVLTVEERLYTPWQPFKLFDLGAAAFADVGRTWGHDPIGGEPLGLLADVGFGLRLGNARSGLGNVLHIDVAFPLLETKSISNMQLVVETKRSF